MITSDVPIARLVGNLQSKIIAGIIKNPPPAPRIPVNNPIANPYMMVMICFRNENPPDELSFEESMKIIVIAAIIMNEANNNMNNCAEEMTRCLDIYISNKRREISTPITDGIPNIASSGKSTNFLIKYSEELIKLVVPTISKEYELAAIGLMPKK